MPAVSWAENRRLSVEQIAETGKIESADNMCPSDSEGGRSMATKLVPKKSGDETPASKKAPAKKATVSGPAASAKANGRCGV